MNYLYILSEDDTDDIFYTGCLAKITGKAFWADSIRSRGGLSEIEKKLPILLRRIGYSGTSENTFFLVAKDNDRRPIHPNHFERADLSKLIEAEPALLSKSQNSSCRYCGVFQTIEKEFGSNRAAWPVQGAIAVPVEMIETWQLLICNPDEYKNEQSPNMPIYPLKNKKSAKAYYARKSIPDQLKDLVRQERLRLEMGSGDFCRYCVEQLDVEDLMKRSPSFTQFVQQVNDW